MPEDVNPDEVVLKNRMTREMAATLCGEVSPIHQSHWVLKEGCNCITA